MGGGGEEEQKTVTKAIPLVGHHSSHLTHHTYLLTKFTLMIPFAGTSCYFNKVQLPLPEVTDASCEGQGLCVEHRTQIRKD